MRLTFVISGFLFGLLAGMIAACQPLVTTPDVEQRTMPAATETFKAVSPPSATLQHSPTDISAEISLENTVTPEKTATPASSSTPIPTNTATPDMRPDPRQWASWPVIPTVSGRAKEIYQNGLAKGNDPQSVSVIGDCQSEPNVFLGIYATDRYFLGDDYQYLQETIDYYRESFSRQSFGVRDGLSAPSALSSLWADPQNCQPGETPVTCELRAHKPAVMFINLGTNWKPGASAEAYENYLRQIVEQVIFNGTLPILSTKADNIEGDHSLNLATARVAYDYDIPLWNFWLAADSLPNHGLDANRENIYLTPEGWDRRNFTALQTLDAIRRALHGLPPPPNLP